MKRRKLEILAMGVEYFTLQKKVKGPEGQT